LEWRSGNGQFDFSMGLAVDSSGNVYVADTLNNRSQKFDSNGAYLTQWGSEGYGNGQFSGPYGMAVDSSGNVYVADIGNNRIQKFRYNNPPALGFLTPSAATSAANSAMVFSAVYKDADGYADLKQTNLRVGPLVNGIGVRYSRPLNKLYLRNDANTADVGSCTPGVAGTLTNTQGTLFCGMTTVSVSDKKLTVNWIIKPKAAFAGTKNIFMNATDMSGEKAGGTYKGDWTITP
jgi:hypothetical protein